MSNFNEAMVARGGNPANPGEFSSKDEARAASGQLADAFDTDMWGTEHDGEVLVDEHASTLGDYNLGNETSIRHTWPQPDGTAYQVTRTYGVAARLDADAFRDEPSGTSLPDGTDIPTHDDMMFDEHEALLAHVATLREQGDKEQADRLTPLYHTLVQTEYRHLDANGEEMDSNYDSADEQAMFTHSVAEQEQWNRNDAARCTKDMFSVENMGKSLL